MKIVGFLFSSDFYHMPYNRGYFAVRDNFRKKQRLKFLQYVAEDRVRYESIPCLCGNDRFEVLTTLDRHNLPQLTSLCVQCGLMLNNPRLDETSYNFIYSSGLYRDLYAGEAVFEEKSAPVSGGYSRTILDFLQHNDPCRSQRNKVLEIGCNVGKTLYGLKEAGFEVAGIEPDARACEIGNSFNLNIRCGKIEDFRGDNEYDLVIMTEVFEHIYDPAKGLEAIKTFLKPNGALYISVIGLLCPTWRNIKKFTQLAHPYNFSLQTLSMVVEAHGFKLEAGNENIQALFVRGGDSPGRCIAHRENYETIREKFLTLDANYQKTGYRCKEQMKSWIRELLKFTGLFNAALGLREKFRKLRKP